ncbi:MAG: redoxin domain-containing protein [Phycisphaerae bacterium]|nr:redoxin domain-containing protein [Phycisphaerae bacterium]
MKPNELDQLIKSLRTAPSDRLDQRIYALLDSGPAIPSAGVWRRIMRSPITKLATAAMLAVAVFILVRHLSGRETAPDDRTAIVADVARAELIRAEGLFHQADVSGLLTLMETGRYGTKVKIAGYLGQIGDSSALPALEPLAAQWQGAPDTNPFQKAIDAIQQREQPAAEPEPARAEPNAVSERQPGGTPSSRSQRPSPRSLTAPAARRELVTYAGRVIDETGHAVPGVHVWGQALSNTFRNSVLAQETLTDADGTFRLSDARPKEGSEIFRVLYFDHADYGLGWHSLAGSDADGNVQVTLYAPGAVSGVVVDTHGQPIANARIEADVRLSANGKTDQLILWDLTDMALYANDQGEFVLDRLPAPASVRLRVSATGYALFTTPPNSEGEAFPVEVGGESLRIVLEPGSAIAGRIVYEDGTPYEHRAVIIAEGLGIHELVFATEDNGTFTSCGLPAGLYHLNAMKDESKPLCAPVEVQVDLAAGTSQVVLKVLPADQPVAVQVVDETTGDPLENVWVRAEFAEGAEGSVAQARTDRAGHGTLAIPPGRYRIVAQGWQNGRFNEFAEELTLAREQTDAAVVIAMTARANVTGRLIDTNGNPVEGFIQIDSDRPGQTDPNGRFTIEEPFGDAFEYKGLWAYDNAQRIGKTLLFRKADYAGELVIVLEPCATLAGRIVNEASQVQPDVTPKLGICKPGGGTVYYSRVPWTVTVDRDGLFVVAGVPTGLAMRVSAERKGLQGWADVNDLLPGQVRDVGDIVLRGYGGIDEKTDWTGMLEGTITDENNKPVVAVKVKAYTGIDHFEATTDRSGHFKLTGLPQGVRLNFSLYLAGYGHCHKYVYADTDDGDMQIFPQGWELLGKQAPPLSVAKWYNSEPLTLEELRGKVVLLQIGVLVPLYGENLTTMQKVAERYAGRGLEIIAVHQPLDVTWGGEVTDDDLWKFVTEGHVPFAFCLDQERQTYSAYAPKATPALYLIDREGRVVISPTNDNLEACIDQLLGR